MAAVASHRPIQLRALAFAHRVAHRLSGGRLGSLEAGAVAPKGAVLKAITRLHRKLYRLTGGIIGGKAGGLPTLLLTTRGRKSGAERVVPLPYFEHDGVVMVVASFAGNPKHPEWYLNLLAEPEVHVQIGFQRRRARAVVASEVERSQIWPGIVAQAPMYADYQRITERTIPVVLLTKAL